MRTCMFGRGAVFLFGAAAECEKRVGLSGCGGRGGRGEGTWDDSDH